MTNYIIGERNVSCTRDEEGHRTYTVNWHVKTLSSTYGPANILANWGLLPVVGQAYNFGPTEFDPWAFCTPELNISAHPGVADGEPHDDWVITQKFSTKQSWRCNTSPIENPLLEPFQLSGGYAHEQFETHIDKDGNVLQQPTEEPITGPVVEVKRSFPTIEFTANFPVIDVPLFSELVNRVNDATLWGLPPRTIRLSDVRWERLVYGSCFYYFRVTYSFEINTSTAEIPTLEDDGTNGAKQTEVVGFDPVIEATGMLRNTGNIAANGTGTAWELAKNDEGELIGPVMLDSYGYQVADQKDQYIRVLRLAKEGNFLLLGIPPTL